MRRPGLPWLLPLFLAACSTRCGETRVEGLAPEGWITLVRAPAEGPETPLPAPAGREGDVGTAHPLLIEAHDRVSGGIQDYMPLYYEHNLDGKVTFDEHWGFEYMWSPYMDLLAGKALSLYEYNLAHDIPLYLHINLGFDNEAALAFWWYASTCRHLGLGGIKRGHKNWEGHVAAMQEYLRLKPFFAEGRFVGIDLDVHAHVLDEERLEELAQFDDRYLHLDVDA